MMYPKGYIKRLIAIHTLMHSKIKNFDSNSLFFAGQVIYNRSFIKADTKKKRQKYYFTIIFYI